MWSQNALLGPNRGISGREAPFQTKFFQKWSKSRLLGFWQRSPRTERGQKNARRGRERKDRRRRRERAGRRAEYAEGESKSQTPRSPMRAPRPAKAKSSWRAPRPPRAPTRAQNPNGNACQERLIHSKSSACFRSKDADRGRNLLPRRRAMRIAILVISSTLRRCTRLTVTTE